MPTGGPSSASTNSSSPSISRAAIKKLIKQAKRSKREAPYYKNSFDVINAREAGYVQADEKTLLDRVQLAEHRNELIRLLGVDQKGSSFDLTITIISLYPKLQTGKESRWRLANVDFVYSNVSTNKRYTYSQEQLIDYEQKRQVETSQKHETRNIYKIGSLSLETVAPFSLSRILFNGFLTETSLVDGSASDTNEASLSGNKSRLIPVRLNISTHPTCDKFDYKYRFDEEHMLQLVQSGAKNTNDVDKAKRLVESLVEDRFDQPMWFRVNLEQLADKNSNNNTKTSDGNGCDLIDDQFCMWGTKIKKFHDAWQQLRDETATVPHGDLDDQLFIWAESGQQVHLTRPQGSLNLVYGMVDNSFDYASPISDIKLFAIKKRGQNDEQQDGSSSASDYEEVSFDKLESFEKISSDFRITFCGFQGKKAYTIEFLNLDTSDSGRRQLPQKCKFNKFNAWTLGGGGTKNLAQCIRRAQSKLWILPINDELISSKLADERLLGGKGNSLIDLAKLTRAQLANIPATDTNRLAAADDDLIRVSVPNGVVVSCVAYRLWFQSSSLIARAIHELDCTRRALAARLICSNPFSSRYMPLGQAQKILKEQCQKTCLILNSCPLPNSLRKMLYDQLVAQFGEQNLIEDESGVSNEQEAGAETGGKKEKRLSFAIRSSAVGEDSLETSAAGQMRTILGARGFGSICRSIVECWSSQFELAAVTYKTQNGLDFNLPMAVVIQELIHCKSAGVAATCDPLTGNKLRLEITANWGLGEGVVAGKQTDTIRVALDSLAWSSRGEEFTELLTIRDALVKQGVISKFLGDPDKVCCLSDEQVVALANVLIKLRQTSTIKEREVEWGITRLLEGNASDSPSSSSSSSSTSSSSQDAGDTPGAARFQIHLLQSRPLTNLQRQTADEIRHELDSGLCSPYDLYSRANLGEVMPGSMSPTYLSFMLPISTSFGTRKPFEKQHSRKVFVGESFAYYAGIITMVLTNSDTLSRMAGSENPDDMKLAKAAIYSMIGSIVDESQTSEEERQLYDLFRMEKLNPLSPTRRDAIVKIFAFDCGLLIPMCADLERSLKSTILNDDLPPVDKMIEEIEQQHNLALPKSGRKKSLSKGSSNDNYLSTSAELEWQIERLFERIISRTEPLGKAWRCHILATVVSMAFNVICLRLLSSQPCYPADDIVSPEILNDFSILVRGHTGGKQNKLGKQTESGDVSKLMECLIRSIVEDGQLELVRKMSQQELYDYLANEGSNTPNCSRLYRNFMAQNGHRAFKEFDFRTKTWSDDPSYIMNLLFQRLKQFKGLDELERQRLRLEESEREQEQKLAAVEAKLERAKFMLTKYVLPRARNAIIRRERSKSLIIKSIHKWRLALRHLGALLCLAGRLPDPDLVVNLTIEELEQVVKCEAHNRADLSRLIDKARRRLQQSRLVDKVKFPHPTMRLHDMIQSVEQQLTANGSPTSQPPQSTTPTTTTTQNNNQLGASSPETNRAPPSVTGLISCGGCVTGRACVVSSLDEMDQLQPGDILITYSIDISWTVYFYTLAGIVTEVGGIVSHGAVVAREYGLPTLCTALGACSKFKTGQLVTLDADRGVCYLASEQSVAENGLSADTNHIATATATTNESEQPASISSNNNN